jgi:hypothetical protein
MPALKDFGRKAMDSKSGTWFEITDKASAKLAGRASDTAIGFFTAATQTRFRIAGTISSKTPQPRSQDLQYALRPYLLNKQNSAGSMASTLAM